MLLEFNGAEVQAVATADADAQIQLPDGRGHHF